MNEHAEGPTDATENSDGENSDVDRALAGLANLEGLPVDLHVAVYEDIHTTLRATLSRPAGG